MSETTKDYFNAYAKTYDSISFGRAEFNERYAIWKKEIDQESSAHSQSLCIDLGCGNGFLSVHAASLGYRVVSVDGSSEMLSLTKRLAEKESVSPQMTFIESFLPLSSELEDQYVNQARLILMSSVIEYVQDYEGVFRQSAALLEQGGVFLVSFPNKASLYRKIEFSLRNTSLYEGSYVRHQIRQFGESDVKELASKHGFQVLYITYFALPFQRYTSKLFQPHFRPKWASTLFLAKLKKV